jgi:hypothetical protein
MMKPNQLKVGCIYFALSYEDDALTRPMVISYEYLGVGVDGPPKTANDTVYFFRFLGEKDLLELKEEQVPNVIMDVPELIESLKEWSATQTAASR